MTYTENQLEQIEIINSLVSELTAEPGQKIKIDYDNGIIFYNDDEGNHFKYQFHSKNECLDKLLELYNELNNP